MKRVVMIHHFGGLGGAGKSLINNVKLLSKECRLTVILPESPSEIRKRLENIDNIELITFSFIPSVPIYSGGYSLISPGFYLHIVKSLLSLRLFLSVIKDTNSDVIVVNSIIMSWLSIFFHKTKKVCFVRETKCYSLFNYIHRSLLNKFDLVCFISHFDKKSWGLRALSIVNENSVENDIISEPTINKLYNNKLNLVYLGGTSYIKGFYHLCASIYRMKYKNRLNVFILGDCRPFGIKFAKYIFRDYFPFTIVGKVSDVSNYYQISDAVIFPVVKVHQGRPIFEAGQYRIGAIVPDYKNFDEFVKNMRNGIIYEKGSSKALAKVLSQACDGNIDFKLLGERNFRVFEKKHSLKVFQQRSQNIIKKIIQI